MKKVVKLDLLIIIIALFCNFLLTSCDEQPQRPQEALFVFGCPPDKETFLFKLTDPRKIQKARDILSGKETNMIHVKGIIIKEPADYNPRWSYHLDPASIDFFALAIEVCDANMKYVEEHLIEVGGSFLPNNHWCPWCSQLIKEQR
ncbi:MAG: hypothetical protein WBD99_02005 [Thermodesulfobacteriota bacterium]